MDFASERNGPNKPTGDEEAPTPVVFETPTVKSYRYTRTAGAWEAM